MIVLTVCKSEQLIGVMDDDSLGFTFFLNVSFKQHERDFPHDKITFHDFSSICMKNWEVCVIYG